MTQAFKYILTLDLGTSGPKVSLISTRCDVIASEFEPTPLSLLPNGGVEQDPLGWWNAITAASRRLLAQNAVPPQDIIAISLSSQWSGTVAVDKDGAPLMNAIIWMDTRGAEHVKRLTGGGLEVQGYRVDKLLRWVSLTAGIPGHSGKDSLAHILYLREARPDIYHATHKFLEPKDFVNFKLTGLMLTSYETVALHWITDNRNITRIDYDPGLLALTGLNRAQLPDLRPAASILGPLTPQATVELGLPAPIPVTTGLPDLHAAALGSGAVRDYEAHLYVGTSSWITCHVPFKGTDFINNMATLPSGLPGRYIVADEQEMAGACLTFLKDQILFAPDAPDKPEGYAFLDRLAESAPPGSDRLLFAPWLVGERTPVEDHTVRGAFFNLSLGISRNHLARAVLEGVAFNSRWLLGGLEPFTRHKYAALNFIGGGAQSAVWAQIFADVLNRPIRQMRDPIRAPGRGAAALALIALGLATVDEIAALTPVAHTFTPNPDHRQIYDELFREFVNIYQRNQPIYARLNRHR